MSLTLPTLARGTFTTAHASWETMFKQTLLDQNRASNLGKSYTDLLSVALALTRESQQPIPPIELPFRYTFPSNGLLHRGGPRGIVTSEVTVFRKLAAYNVLVNLWNAVGAGAKTSHRVFPDCLIQKPVVQALSRFYKVWHAVVTPSLQPDIPTIFKDGPLTKCAERCVWAMLHFVVLGASPMRQSSTTAADIQSRLARTAAVAYELKTVVADNTTTKAIATVALTLQTHAKAMFLDTLIYKLSCFDGWFDSISDKLPEALKGQVLVHAANSAAVTSAISAGTRKRLERDHAAYMCSAVTAVDPTYSLETLYIHMFPSPAEVAGTFDILPVEAIDYTTSPTEWGWWGEPTEL